MVSHSSALKGEVVDKRIALKLFVGLHSQIDLHELKNTFTKNLHSWTSGEDFPKGHRCKVLRRFQELTSKAYKFPLPI